MLMPFYRLHRPARRFFIVYQLQNYIVIRWLLIGSKYQMHQHINLNYRYIKWIRVYE